MGLFALAVALALATAGPAVAGDDIALVHETRTPEPPRAPRESGKRGSVRHVALVKNTGSRPVRALRVSVELYDYFGKLLWARTVVPTPSALEPGETAALSLSTPDLDAYRRTRYRFEYRPATTAR